MMLRSAAAVVQEEVPAVQGKQASSYEYNVAWALEKTEIPYIFQFEFFGGRDVRGGLVVDFLALTHPLSTPIWCNGGFWHKGKRAAEDEYQQTLLFFVARGELNRPVVLWDNDVRTNVPAMCNHPGTRPTPGLEASMSFIITTTKTCGKCGETKPLSEFH